MPTAVSNSSEPPTSQQRRPSTHSQTSLIDHARPRPRFQTYPYPSDHLSSTTHSTPQLYEKYSSTQQSTSTADNGGQTTDPDDFYREYRVFTGEAAGRSLHQNAFHPTNPQEEIRPLRARNSSVASTQSHGRHALRNSKSQGGSQEIPHIITTKSSSALGMRKSSFKDLVARFDASPDDIPPVPVFPDAIAGSRKTSPVLNMAAQGNTWKHAASASLARPETQQSSIQAKKSRPLFGEVFSGVANSTAGYGIVNPRRRRGSEASPMHSPNPMFADNQQMNFTSSHLPYPPQSNGIYARVSPDTSLPAHRRATSELSPSGAYAAPANESAAHQQGVEQSHHRRMSLSRIPVRTRRLSLDSGSGTSTPSSRAPSRVGNSASIQGPSARTKLPTVASIGRSSRTTGSQLRNNTANKSTAQTTTGISPTQGQKSPSLRANIIAPPPKISPPLRSSRPRLPVSSATTAASRARIAERFQTMAKEQNDRRSTSRKVKPSELSDVDLKARRLKITQALTKSREGQDLKCDGLQSKRTSTSATPGSSDVDPNSRTRSSSIPAVVVGNASLYNDDDDVFTTPNEGVLGHHDGQLTEEARRAATIRRELGDAADSPTLGQSDGGYESALPRLNIPVSQTLRNLEEDSAVTQGTVETVFEDDDRVEAHVMDHDRPSLYSHVQDLREAKSTSSIPDTLPADGHALDRTDAESVNIILRNTTYMDEDEAVEKGYRTFMPPPLLPDLYEGSSNGQGSWTSSIGEVSEHDTSNDVTVPDPGVAERASPRALDEQNQIQDLLRATTASDTYTIVNIVLQERSSSGVVDQELVDAIYSRIIEEEPDLAQHKHVDSGHVEDLCLQSLQRYALEQDSPDTSNVLQESNDSDERGEEQTEERCDDSDDAVERRPPPLPKDSLPPTSYRSGHKYKSSLDSVEDWADTSPSIGWLSYALNQSESEKAIKASPLAHEASEDDGEYGTIATLGRSSDPPVPPKDDFSGLPPHSPPSPLPPVSKARLTDSSVSVAPLPPDIPGRIASLSQMSSRPVTRESSNVAPSFTTQEGESPLAKQLKRRRHIMKEIVDTEFTYERDMRVLCDIYKQTAIAVLTDDDVKIVFGNVEEIQQFSKDFLTYLKQVVRPVYVMDRQKRATNSHADQNSVRSISPDLTGNEKDRLTQVGVAFEASVNDMSVVYTNYIKSRHVANKRLSSLQNSPAVSEWLRECSENSKDITHAWSLDALSVKPIQRITKYPLLLASLLEATPSDHPDIEDLRKALAAVTEINFRINDIKKQTEILDQVLNRKRKESDVRNGLTKAFGRRAERLRQHVGVSEVYEDGEFSRLKMEYDNNGVHLLIVSKDIQGYVDAMKGWVAKLTEVAAAAEAWVDVGHSSHPEAESKLRHLGSTVRGINTIALPDHIDLVTRKVIQPLESAMVMIERFKTDPKGLIYKREKKILDYSTARNKKDRGEKLDRKMTERLEQWEAINAEVKQRMRKLLESTQSLVHSCLQNLVNLHMSWLTMIQHKLSSAMAIDLDRDGDIDLIREWQVDFDYHEATALTLGICNGTLLTEAINLVSFLSPSTTMTGDDSPRQRSSNSGKRSTSMHSDFSHPPYQSSTRYSSGQHSTHDYPSENSSVGVNSSRMRATSTTSGQLPARGSDAYTRTSPSGHGVSRPATSLGHDDRPSNTGSIKNTTMVVPRVSLDAPSPSIGPIAPLGTPTRPESAATFFSATGGSSPTPSSQHIARPSTTSEASTIVDTNAASINSSIFSSAMPLSDSPATERAAGNVPPGLSPAGVEEPQVLFTVASVYEFNIDRARQEGGIPYLTYVAGEIFDVIGERGELWLSRNQDDPSRQIGWIWCKHFAKLAT